MDIVIDNYRRQARLAEELAGQSNDAAQRDRYLKVAERWRQLGDAAERIARRKPAPN